MSYMLKQYLIHLVKNNTMPSKETLKRAVYRGLLAMVAGAAGAFVFIPVNLEDPKRYLVSLSVGMIAGALMGLQKLIKGYIKYDKI